MKVALLADVHANIFALDAVMNDIQQQDIDHMIFAGDVVGYYPYPNEVCTILRQKVDWCIQGNHDAFITGRLSVPDEIKKLSAIDYTLEVISKDHLQWLKSLPEFLSLELSSRIFKIFHGSPWNYLEEYIYPDYRWFSRFETIEADYVILGHTHYPMVKHQGEKVIINPGSCGQPRDYNPGSSYAVIDAADGRITIHHVYYDCQQLINTLNKLKFDKKASQILLRRR